jgi:hypothetical protein
MKDIKDENLKPFKIELILVFLKCLNVTKTSLIWLSAQNSTATKRCLEIFIHELIFHSFIKHNSK